MTHMKVARRVRKHVKDVASRLCPVVKRAESLIGCPILLPLLLSLVRVIAVNSRLLAHIISFQYWPMLHRFG
jgi:hypothetical protein